MIFGGWLLKRLKPLGLMTLGMVVIGLRVLLYSAFNFPEAILLFQLLHGLTYPAIWIAGVAYAYENAPGGLRVTGQGLFGASMVGLGAAVGGFLGGLLIDVVGSRGMYLIFGAIVLLSALLFWLMKRSLAPGIPKGG
jgi:MFS family permease